MLKELGKLNCNFGRKIITFCLAKPYKAYLDPTNERRCLRSLLNLWDEWNP